jgi:tryptophanyl-tRNA synthetase
LAVGSWLFAVTFLNHQSISGMNSQLQTLNRKLLYLRRLMADKKQIVMSGIRPTGFLHLGNYFGAVRNYVRMQEEYQCYFMVADLHSLTTHPDTKELKLNVHRVLSENIACGLDPDKVALYCQSHIHETAELYLYLNMLAYKGELEKTTTFKDKVRLQPDNVNAGLLTYPVLQTADIILHRASLVPVGKDQEQHLFRKMNFLKHRASSGCRAAAAVGSARSL